MSFPTDIKSAVPFEVETLEDLIRWIVSSSQGQNGTLFHFKKDTKDIMSTFIILPGYYDYQGLPIILYTDHDEAPQGPFLRFDIRKDANSRISYVNGFDDRDSNLGYIQYLPIITLKKIPAIFNFD